MEGEGNFVGMSGTPGDDALEFDGIVGDGADFRHLGFNDLRVSHRKPASHTWKSSYNEERRYDRCEYLVDRVITRSRKYKKFQHPKRQADFEEVVLREVISAVAARSTDLQPTISALTN
jgi:hypothetical protein